MSHKFTYECNDCGSIFPGDRVMYLCQSCSLSNKETLPPKGVLKVIYDYESLKKSSKKFTDLSASGFIDILPINQISSLPPLRIGNTPLSRLNTIDGEHLPFRLHLKDDSMNPTFSFKDRASALVSAFAKENNLGTIVAASTGNAGSSIAGICASQGQKAVVMVPEKAPAAKLSQVLMYGATLIPVKGSYDDCFELSKQATEEFGWYNRNTAFNPLTIEGKKSVSFEVYSQLGHAIPGTIFVSAGDGVILSGIYKGFEDLMRLGFIKKIPKVIAVQSSGSDNLVRNIGKSEFIINKGTTIADSISVDVPRNFLMAQKYILKYEGEGLTVSDDEIIAASGVLSRNSGLLSEPAAAAAFAGMLKYRETKGSEMTGDVVVLLTGSGLKDMNALKGTVSMPQSVDNSIDALQKIL